MALLSTLFRLGFDIGLVVGPHIGYISQFFDMHRSGSTAGYARLVSLILLVSYTLRIFYYFGEHFALALLFQSVSGVFVHAILISYVLSVELREWNLGAISDGDFEPHGVTGITAFGSDSPGWTAPDNEAASGRKKTEEDELALHPLDEALLQGGGDKDRAALTTGVTDKGENARTALSDTATAAGYTAINEQGPDLLEGLSVSAVNTGVQEEDVEGAGFPLYHLLQLESLVESKITRLYPQSFLLTYLSCVLAGIIFFPFYYGMTRFVLNTSGAPLVGYVALGFEALLVLPQILKNARRGSTQGLDRFLVATWICGDTIKMIYFLVLEQPLPFLLCGGFQLCLDVIVVYQLYLYRNVQSV